MDKQVIWQRLGENFQNSVWVSFLIVRMFVNMLCCRLGAIRKRHHQFCGCQGFSNNWYVYEGWWSKKNQYRQFPTRVRAVFYLKLAKIEKFLRIPLILDHNLLVYNQNLVSVSVTDTKIKSRYRFRGDNFFCLNRNFCSICL